MDNNDLFIDTMDKINTLAKSRGFVNGNDWAKTATRKNAISEVQLSSFENVHTLRNLMAHGHARDIVISPETLSITMHFLTALAGSNLTPAAKVAEINWSDPSYLQPGDLILFPYFQGFIDIHSGAPKQGIDIMDLYYNKLEESCYLDERAGFIFCVGEDRVLEENVGTRLRFVPKAEQVPKVSLRDPEITPGVPMMCIVLRPSAELRMRLVSAKTPLYVQQYILSDGKLTFAIGSFTGRVYSDGRHEISLEKFSCRAYCVPMGAVYATRTPATEPYLKLRDGYFLSFPPAEGHPYSKEYEIGKRDIWSLDSIWAAREEEEMRREFGSYNDLPF